IAVRVGGVLVAAGRLTPGPNAWFEFDSNGEADIPTGPDVMDFGRVVVAPAHRGRGHELFELVLIEGLLLSTARGFRWVVGAYRTDRGFRLFIHELGFQICGAPVGSRLAPAHERYQMVFVNTEGHRDHWTGRKVAVLDRLRGKGYQIIDHGCSAGEGHT